MTGTRPVTTLIFVGTVPCACPYKLIKKHFREKRSFFFKEQMFRQLF